MNKYVPHEVPDGSVLIGGEDRPRTLLGKFTTLTADGAVIADDAKVWCWLDDELCECEVLSVGGGLVLLGVGETGDTIQTVDVQSDRLYSTKKAAGLSRGK